MDVADATCAAGLASFDQRQKFWTMSDKTPHAQARARIERARQQRQATELRANLKRRKAKSQMLDGEQVQDTETPPATGLGDATHDPLP